MTEKPNDKYIGDGVYVSDDGYQLWLANGHHNNRVIALDPQVCAFLIREMTRIMTAERICVIAQALVKEGEKK